MEENKLDNGHHHDHYDHHHGGEKGGACCGLMGGCCSGSKPRVLRIFMAIVIALAVFSIGLSLGSRFNGERSQYRGYGMMFGNRFERARGGINNGSGTCQFKDQNGSCSLKNVRNTPINPDVINQATPAVSTTSNPVQ